MAKKKVTPMMEQYLAVKKQYPDAFLFYRLGDFYEMFYDDAIKGSQLLELTLTQRNKNSLEPIPMCGVPHHAAKTTSIFWSIRATRWQSVNRWKTLSRPKGWLSGKWFS